MLGLAMFGIVGRAQQPQPSNPASAVQQPRKSGPAQRAMRRRATFGMFRVLRQLNLTDQQKQQARSIIQTNMQSTKAQRQELSELARQWRQGTLTPAGLTRANELHKQFLEARKTVRTQLTGILTQEQKEKLDEMIKARRSNHGLFGRQG